MAQQGFLAGPLDKINTSTIEDAPPAAGRFPVVVLEPGLGLSAPQLTTLGQELASQGFVVAAVTPTYSANVTVLDGRVVGRTDKGNPQDPSDAELGALVTVWAADARFAAAALPSWDGAHTDTAHVAYIGHSLGGAASLPGMPRRPRVRRRGRPGRNSVRTGRRHRTGGTVPVARFPGRLPGRIVHGRHGAARRSRSPAARCRRPRPVRTGRTPSPGRSTSTSPTTPPTSWPRHCTISWASSAPSTAGVA